MAMLKIWTINWSPRPWSGRRMDFWTSLSLRLGRRAQRRTACRRTWTGPAWPWTSERFRQGRARGCWSEAGRKINHFFQTQHRQCTRAVWCLLGNNSLKCFVIIAKTKRHFNCPQFHYRLTPNCICTVSIDTVLDSFYNKIEYIGKVRSFQPCFMLRLQECSILFLICIKSKKFTVYRR